MSEIGKISRIDAQLHAICDRASYFEQKYAEDLVAVNAEFRDSARNLVHYLALRHDDIRELQENLASLGLSSLGRAERNVLPSIRMVQRALRKIAGNTGNQRVEVDPDLRLKHPSAQLHRKAIFGDSGNDREVSIMVTLPTDAGSNSLLVADMIATGMNVARINCAHDSQPVWTEMIRNVRAGSRKAGKECRIVLDLSGPKLRTGALLPGPRVVHVRPRRDPLGRVIAPRRLRFIPDDIVWQGKKSAIVPVPRECIEFAGVGDKLRFRDARGKKRTLRIVAKDADGLIVESYKAAYIVTGTKLRLIREETGEKLRYRVGELPSIEQAILLRSGDTLVLHRDNTMGAPAIEDANGEISKPAHISCQQYEVFDTVGAGDPVWLNDGKIGGIVRTASSDRLLIEITHAKPTGSRLRGDCGISFPHSKIQISGLSASDRSNLEFAALDADAVCLSFVRTPADIVLLQDELKKHADKQLGLIIKIETEEGFNNLPELLLTTMRSYPVAVMIARGDLAVECGWERLAELQEEILWLCEAAQMPVIWATDVLRQKAKKGKPSRAEITDAAMSQRADCVMLNKGPHILATIRMLDNILRRMQNHQYKKTARLRRLSISGARDQANADQTKY
ncbi:MAG: pyruvate kinase [Gammaproteobacteria bacterium]|nr:pyruvate kinase [Gammaproteobacteria bacterium]MDH4314555.1 pyruvate kinase [Gammaproteobacteria bacterium]MDH5213760.1 pyruvate kinase [Gammaproteobacteria bacterium]